jgi:hypothetical protein
MQDCHQQSAARVTQHSKKLIYFPEICHYGITNEQQLVFIPNAIP